ncbi:MAG: LLM class flavin-dependent oxidoreductase [Propionibacteriaceae bacterium]
MSDPTTTDQPRLGFAFVPTNPPDRLLPIARAVEDSGLDDLWVWEDCFAESGIAAATAALATTERIRVGLGLMPAPLRNVALAAMEVSTVMGMFPGRFVPGIGHGIQPWMAQAGAKVDSPMTLLREYADALRRLLDGEEVTVDGRYVRLDAVKLAWPPAEPRLTLGGSGPKTLELAGVSGDGTLLAAALTTEALRESSDTVARARTAAGLPAGGAHHEVLATQIVATGPDAAARVEAELPFWGGQPGQDIGVGGDAETIAASVRTMLDLGATAVVFQPTQDVDDLPGLISFLGAEVRPLLA